MCQMLVDIYSGLKNYKARTFFTGFGVIWGMFIFVLLQAGMTGYYQGVIKRFHSYGEPTISIYTNRLSAHKPQLTESLADQLADRFSMISESIPVFKRYEPIVCEGSKHTASILGVPFGYASLAHLDLEEGRFFTHRDIAEALPVCILDVEMKRQLFGATSAVGALIAIRGAMLVVVGVTASERGDYNNSSVMLPHTRFKQLFPRDSHQVNHIICALKNNQEEGKIIDSMRMYLAKALQLTNVAEDELYMSSSLHESKSFNRLFTMLKLFCTFVSLSFLISGAVALGSMMLLVVKKRTYELAIRRIVGATSGHVAALILSESVIITLISGIFGIGLGLGVVQGVNHYLAPMLQQYDIAHFTLPYSMMLPALAVLLLVGALVGLIPARKAYMALPADILNND